MPLREEAEGALPRTEVSVRDRVSELDRIPDQFAVRDRAIGA